MTHEKFDVAKLDRLNDVARFEYLAPDVLWAAADVHEPRSIVDVGAGTGLFARKFAEYSPDADVFAVDMHPAMVGWMIEHMPPELRDRIHPLLSGEDAVPLPTGEADLVVMINLHHELPEPLLNYREAMRLLRIGGTLLVADWKPGDATHGPPEHCRASAEQIFAVVSAVGFGEVRLHEGLPHHTLLTACKPAVCGL
jgi:SAM-dependent methyltransferase